MKMMRESTRKIRNIRTNEVTNPSNSFKINRNEMKRKVTVKKEKKKKNINTSYL